MSASLKHDIVLASIVGAIIVGLLIASYILGQHNPPARKISVVHVTVPIGPHSITMPV